MSGKESKITEELLEKEQEKLEALEQRYLKQKKRVDDFGKLLKMKSFSEAEDVLAVRGLTLKDVMKAVESGDFSLLQEQNEKRKCTSDQIDPK